MEFTANALAQLLQGEIEGDPEVTVNNLSKIEEGAPNTVSFLSNPQYTEYIYDTDASVVIVAKDFVPERSLKSTCTLIRVEDPRMSFAKILEAYHAYKSNKSGVEQPSYIADSARLGEQVYLGAFAYVGENAVIGNNVKLHPHAFIGDNVTVGDNTVVHAGVRINSESVIGKNCTLHSGVVIGSDGFGFAPNSENNYHKVVHIGNVIVEDHVEIGANTTIDRATLGSTIIRKGVKLDNLIQVAHNVEIGENTVIAAQSGIAGSTKVGKNCMIGGQVGIVGHITIADEVKIAAQSGIGHSIDKVGEIVQGSPAFTIRDYKRAYVVFRNLPQLKERVDRLEDQQGAPS
ncbi:MAG: UDP-3-O-(3-hydroxymyristoyl)glucosamine N-acyltransferase [Salibacteraceae bacterium]